MERLSEWAERNGAASFAQTKKSECAFRWIMNAAEIADECMRLAADVEPRLRRADELLRRIHAGGFPDRLISEAADFKEETMSEYGNWLLLIAFAANELIPADQMRLYPRIWIAYAETLFIRRRLFLAACLTRAERCVDQLALRTAFDALFH